MLTTVFLAVLTFIYVVWSISNCFQAIFKYFTSPSVFINFRYLDGSDIHVVCLPFVWVFVVWIVPSVFFLDLGLTIFLLIIVIIFRRRFLSFVGLFAVELYFLSLTLACIQRATYTWFPFLEELVPVKFLVECIAFLLEYDNDSPLLFHPHLAAPYLNFFRDLIPPIANVDFSILVAVTIISIPYIILKGITDQMYKTARDEKKMSKVSREGPEKPQGHHENRESQKQKSPDSIFQQGFSKNRD